MNFTENLGYEPFRVVLYGIPIYGLHAYGSIFAMRVKKHTKPYIKQVNRVYNLKKFGKNKKEFFELVNRMAKSVGADMIVAIPSSTYGNTSVLQEMFGVVLKRNSDSETRKYNHHLPVNDYGKIDFVKDVRGRKVLLIDDVVTTGKSILFYRKFLMDAGADSVFSAGIGISISLASFCPEYRIVDEVFDSIRNEIINKNVSIEMEYVPEENSLETLLEMGENNLKNGLMETKWIEVSSQFADLLNMEAKRLGVTEEEVLRMAMMAIRDGL